MIYSLTTNDDRLNEMFLSTHTIELTEAQIARAIELSQRLPTEAQQWQLYTSALGVLGLEQWLQKRAPELSIQSDWLSDQSFPQNQPFIESIRQLQVNGFHLYLLTSDDIGATEFPLPRIAIENPSEIPHLYVLIEVLEELGQVQIQGAIQQSALVQRLQSTDVDADHYWLDAEWFDSDPNQLLLWLRCLDPAALPRLTFQPTSDIAPQVPTNVLGPLTQGAINVGAWLSDRLDQFAQELAWTLLPPPTPTPVFRAMRSPVEEFNTLFTGLIQQGTINPPMGTRGAYQNFELAGVPLRLYAATWAIPNTADWTLLLILGAQANQLLPIGTRLQVRDESQVLEEPVLGDRSQDYLFAQVIGTGAECFWVTVTFSNGASLTLPPFTFVPDAAA
jgi:hypothetical protein